MAFIETSSVKCRLVPGINTHADCFGDVWPIMIIALFVVFTAAALVTRSP